MMRTVVCNERRRVMVIVCSYCQSISVFRISLSQSINEFFCYQLIRWKVQLRVAKRFCILCFKIRLLPPLRAVNIGSQACVADIPHDMHLVVSLYLNELFFCHLPWRRFQWRGSPWRCHCSFVESVNVFGTRHATRTIPSFSCERLFSPIISNRT